MEFAKLRADYERDGVVRIRNFFTKDQVAAARSEIERYIRDDLDSKPNDARTLEADGKTVRNLWRLNLHNAFFQELAEDDQIRSLAEALLGPNPRLWGVETFNKPARIGSAVPPHQDNAYFCQDPPQMFTLWIALEPVTMENGPIYFLPGSHRHGVFPTKPSGVTGNSIGLAESPATPLEEQFCGLLNVGDATVHHANTVHHSAANHSEASRLGLLFVFSAADTKTDDKLMATYQEAVTATPPA